MASIFCAWRRVSSIRVRSAICVRSSRLAFFQLAGPFDHQRFELVRGTFARFEQCAHLVLAMPPAQRRLHGTGEGNALHRTFQQRDVAQRGDHALAPSGHGRLLMLAGEHHEGKIGPKPAVGRPGGQSREVMAEQAFLGDEYGVGFRFRARWSTSSRLWQTTASMPLRLQLGRGGPSRPMGQRRLRWGCHV